MTAVAAVAAACRAGVGAVLFLAGFSKLRRRSWTATAVRFGTPRRLVPVVPWVELVLGALLIAGAGGRLPVFAALALLGAFTGVMAERLSSRAERVPCGCFGEASPRPVGRDSLIRNGVLLVACLLALGGVGGGSWAAAGVGVAAGAAFVVVARREAGHPAGH